MSEVEKMNSALFGILRKTVVIATDAMHDYIEEGITEEEGNARFFAACAEIRQLIDVYKPSEKVKVEERDEPIMPGCPSLMPRQLPGGFDGTAPDTSKGEATSSSLVEKAEIPSSTSGEDAASPLEKEELKKRGAKLFACNERMRERIVEIAHLANECLLNTNHPNGYEPGQYGQDYRTYGKTIGQIRKTCKESMVEECVPDYEWLAKIMTREGFDPECLAKAIEAEASQRPIDYPTFYTPGWLCELAKKLEAQEPIREDSPNSPDSRSEAKAEKNKNLEFYGLKLNRFGGAGLGAKLIGKRVNVDKTVQVFEIEVKRGNLATGARAFVTENGELLFSLVGGKSFAAVEQMAVSALHRLLDRRADNNKRRNLARKAKRAAAAKAEAENGGQA